MRIMTILIMLLPLSGVTQVTLDWLQFTRGVAIATDDANNVYTVDWFYESGGDIYLTKRNSAGTLVWETKYENTDMTRHEVATWVAVDNDNNIIVTGTIRSGFASPVDAASLVMKFDPAGNLVWRNVYETSFDGSSTKKCLIDASNNIYVLGMGSGAPGYVLKVKKFAPDGTALWSYFDADGIGAAQNFKFTPDNKIVISARGIIGSVNGFTKIDLDGNVIWSYAPVFSNTVGDVAGDYLGNSYLINGEYVAGVAGSVLTKLNGTGIFVWEQVNDIAATKVEVGTDNKPIIGGFPNSGSFGVSFMKYNGSGLVLWQNLDADGPGYNLMLHAMMKLDAANNAYLAAGTLFEMAVCKVNADGSSGWVAHCSGGYANCFDFGSDYSIYVVGGTTAHFNEAGFITCETPIGLYTDNITSTKARLNWTLEPGVDQYEIWYKKVTAGSWKKKFVPGTSSKLTVKNLLCNTSYVWKIRTICDTTGVDLVSDFSPEIAFITAACREEEDLGNNEMNITLYPVPANSNLTILLHGIPDCVVSIYDITGQLMYTTAPANSEEEIQLSVAGFPNGLYLISVQNEVGFITTEFIVQH